MVDVNSILGSAIIVKLPMDEDAVSAEVAVPSGRDGCLASGWSDFIHSLTPPPESRDWDGDDAVLPLGTGSELGGPIRPWLLERDPAFRKSADLGRFALRGVLCESLFLLRLS